MPSFSDNAPAAVSAGGKGLPEKELDKLCQGRIIKAKAYDTFGKPTHAHFAVVLDPDNIVKKSRAVRCMFISTKVYTEPILAVPGYTFLDGYFIGRWREPVEEIAIEEILNIVLKTPEMLAVQKLVRLAEQMEEEDKRAGTPSPRKSTH
jgi:hypothetical protein